MTTLTKPVRRKVRTITGKELVVILRAEGIALREPGRRTEYLLPYGDAWMRGARLFVEHQKREKKRLREQRAALRAAR